MTAYLHLETPFGNFAAQLRHDDSEPEFRGLHLTPIGALPTVPTTWNQALGAQVLDHDVVTAEGRREAEEAGVVPPAYITPAPAFTINRVRYSTTTLRVTYRTNYRGDRQVWIEAHAGVYGKELSESARAKLGDWFLEHEDEIFTAEFLARDELERAREGHARAVRLADEAAVAAHDALADRDRAHERLQQATTALAEMQLNAKLETL